MLPPLPVHGQRSNYRGRVSRSLLVDARLQGVGTTGPVDEIARHFQCHKDLAYAPCVVSDLHREEGGLGPGLAEDLVHGEVAAWMIEQELEELKLSCGQCGLPTL